MKTHRIKLAEKYWQPVDCGEKTFEVRKDDRGYEVGDEIVFLDPRNEELAGLMPRRITYKLTHGDFPEGVPEGYCVLGLNPQNTADCYLRALGFEYDPDWGELVKDYGFRFGKVRMRIAFDGDRPVQAYLTVMGSEVSLEPFDLEKLSDAMKAAEGYRSTAESIWRQGNHGLDDGPSD